MPAADRAALLIEQLGLSRHPEGGHFGEVFRSAATVRPDDERPRRAALTAIYFLLAEGDASGWHRVRSDETWHYHEGAPLDLLIADPEFTAVSVVTLGPFDREAASEPLRVVPAGWWQAARSTGSYTLVSCDVGPGFEFADFVMLRDLVDLAESVRLSHPRVASFI